MKTQKHLLPLMAMLLVACIMQSCSNKRDDKGRLLTKYITTSSGTLNFTPMVRSDSASVKSFKRDTIFFKGEPYTGALANYDANQNLLIEGYTKNGLMDSTWKFYYASGAVLMEGKYHDGIDVGMWRSYFGKDRPKVVKLYDDYGYALMRVEYYDNGKIKNYQNIKAPMFGDKERNYTMDEHGGMISIYVEDSVFVVKQGETTERVGKNVFVQEGKSTLDIAK